MCNKHFNLCTGIGAAWRFGNGAGKGTGQYEERIEEPIETDSIRFEPIDIVRIGFDEVFASCETRSVTCIVCKFPRIALDKELVHIDQAQPPDTSSKR